MAGEKVQGALQSLKDERERLDEAIAALEMLIAQGRRGRGRPRKHPPGTKRPPLRAPRPPEKKSIKDRSSGRRRKNAPRGLLRARIREVLAHARRPVAPIELRNAVLASGYPTKSPKTLYSAVFAAAKADPRVRKTQNGFRLK